MQSRKDKIKAQRVALDGYLRKTLSGMRRQEGLLQNTGQRIKFTLTLYERPAHISPC